MWRDLGRKEGPPLPDRVRVRFMVRFRVRGETWDAKKDPRCRDAPAAPAPAFKTARGRGGVGVGGGACALSLQTHKIPSPVPPQHHHHKPGSDGPDVSRLGQC